jgi:hypothetical protein
MAGIEMPGLGATRHLSLLTDFLTSTRIHTCSAKLNTSVAPAVAHFAPFFHQLPLTAFPGTIGRS